MFGEMPREDLASWILMISGYVGEGNVDGASQLFSDMRKKVESNAEIMILMLRICLGHCILNMYIRWESSCAARILFDRILGRDHVTQPSLIPGCTIQGMGFEAEIFHQMVEDGIEATAVTFISLLSACSHSGLTQDIGHVVQQSSL
ncbi:Hypothetical predicted protein [Olea europaea subsp. europaea]|uniref:Pentatricopeptide repeat-containing protein n=1 Tax=Olea europaea subsp. europaea TaxID=158383 RepID=A0A8S0S6H8_OLEEU|nr:Hypothetical predicted protein [Olea europaea subsp. europaea]